MNSLSRLVIALILVVSLVVGYDKYWRQEDPKPVPEPDGRIVAKIIDAKLSAKLDLRVSKLTGTVQATSTDSGWGGFLPTGMVITAPFEVGYFVDLSKLDRSHFFWDQKTKTLIVTPPDVRVDKVNIDESRVAMTMNGVWVTRTAVARLFKRASARADQVSRAEASKPQNIMKARENGRREIADLYQRPLDIAGVDAKVVVQFEGEGRRNAEQWDRSRSIAEILAAGR